MASSADGGDDEEREEVATLEPLCNNVAEEDDDDDDGNEEIRADADEEEDVEGGEVGKVDEDDEGEIKEVKRAEDTDEEDDEADTAGDANDGEGDAGIILETDDTVAAGAFIDHAAAGLGVPDAPLDADGEEASSCFIPYGCVKAVHTKSKTPLYEQHALYALVAFFVTDAAAAKQSKTSEIFGSICAFL
jgi:hypothetical protein